METSNRILCSKMTRLLKPAVGLLLILTVLPLRVDAQGPPAPGVPVVITEGQGMATLTGRQNQVISTVLYPDPNDPEHAIDPRTGRNFHWDSDKKAWVNSQTGESVNVSGYLCSPPQQTTTSQGPPSPGTPVVITEGQGMATLTGRQNQVISTVLYPDPNDPEHAIDPRTGRNFHWDSDKKAWVDSQTGESVNVSGCLCSAPPAATSPTSTTPKPPNQPAPNNPVSMSGFTLTIQLRGFGGASFINGNTPANAGFDGAVLFPLGNRVLVGPTAGFQWVDSSIVKTIGGGPPPSTFINTSVGFKSGNFGGRIAFPFGGWQLGIRGGATVAGSTITQATGFCGGTSPTAPPTCTVTSTTTTHDTVVGPFVGAYISHSIFSHVGVFGEYGYRHLKDGEVFDLDYSDAHLGLVLSFGRHQVK